MNAIVEVSAPQLLTGAALLALLPVLDLSPGTQRDIASAISITVGIADQPAEAVLFSCQALNGLLYKAAPRVLGLSPDRHGEVVSLLRRVLRLVDRHAVLEKGPDSLNPAWRALHDALGSRWRQMPLIEFMRFCSRAHLSPEEVTDATLVGFEQWCTTWKLGDDFAGKSRRIAANWTWARDNVPGWPSAVLTRPSMREQYTLPLESYPAEFVADVERFTERLAFKNLGSIFTKTAAEPRTMLAIGQRNSRSRRRALRPRTVVTRIQGILFAAAAHPRESVKRLRDLVDPPERVQQSLTFHILRLQKRRSEQAIQAGRPDLAARSSEIVQSAHLATIAEVLRQIAKFDCDPPLAPADLAQIVEWTRLVTPEGQTTMTAKNRERLRRLIQSDKRAMLLHLPQELLRQAVETDKNGAQKLTPKAAATKALYALALEILLVCPIRRDNLANLRLDVELLRTGRSRLITDIQIDASHVKNGRVISWPLPEGLSHMMQVFIDRHRPLLLDGTPNMHLFPGALGKARNAAELGTTLSELITREIGTEINTHLLRHFAAWRYLTRHPGATEIVRLALGHASAATAIRYYAGLEAAAAARHFDEVLLKDRQETQATAAAIFGKRRGRPLGSKNKPKPRSPK